MPDWLLDTNAVSALMRQEPGVEAWLAGLADTDTLFLSTIVHGEIGYGLHRLPPGKRKRALEQAYALTAARCGAPFEVSTAIAETYSRLKAGLEMSGVVLPENDLWIAATALAVGLSLCTADHHFDAVPGLHVADWSAHDPGSTTSRPVAGPSRKHKDG